MHRAKHRAVGRASSGAGSEVLATTLVERFAAVPAPRSVPDAPRSPFGAARHARASRPAPPATPGGRPRSQPGGVTLSATVLGAAAAVSAVVVPPPTAVESTGSAPVRSVTPAPAPATPLGPTLAAPAPSALPDEPTVQIDALVDGVTAQMQQVERPYTTVANTAALSPAAVRKAAVAKALSKLGTPYRYGAMGPNAFDCSGLVKWSFGQAGRKSLPRTSRALATAGVPVRKADLQPGDLVFFYKPISHVGIYIGNGKIVHASRKGQPVKVADMSRMRFTKAVRV
jgi:cell wall-associated NlpC family hydrolase